MDENQDKVLKSMKAHQRDPEANRLGFLIGSLRVEKELSRPQLVRRIHKVLSEMLPEDHPLHDDVTETWLRYIENGRKGVSRLALEVIAQALECKLGERLGLLVAADRSVLADTNGITDSVAEVVSRLAVLIYEDQEIKDLIRLLLANRKASSLTEDELREIWTAIVRLKG